jgi:hypothetical protein
MPLGINANKPQLWKADIAASVDQFNQWFLEFAPELFKKTRAILTEHVKAALVATSDLRNLTPEMLADRGALPTLRMSTAPPLAVGRLIGLVGSALKRRTGPILPGPVPFFNGPAPAKTLSPAWRTASSPSG